MKWLTALTALEQHLVAGGLAIILLLSLVFTVITYARGLLTGLTPASWLMTAIAYFVVLGLHDKFPYLKRESLLVAIIVSAVFLTLTFARFMRSSNLTKPG